MTCSACIHATHSRALDALACVHPHNTERYGWRTVWVFADWCFGERFKKRDYV